MITLSTVNYASKIAYIRYWFRLLNPVIDSGIIPIDTQYKFPARSSPIDITTLLVQTFKADKTGLGSYYVSGDVGTGLADGKCYEIDNSISVYGSTRFIQRVSCLYAEFTSNSVYMAGTPYPIPDIEVPKNTFGKIRTIYKNTAETGTFVLNYIIKKPNGSIYNNQTLDAVSVAAGSSKTAYSSDILFDTLGVWTVTITLTESNADESRVVTQYSGPLCTVYQLIIAAPTLIAPAAGQSLQQTDVLFKWSSSDPNANRFQLHIEYENGTLFYDSIVYNTEVTVPGFPMDGKRFNWSVKAGNDEIWSNPVSSYFLSIPGTIVAPSLVAPTQGQEIQGGQVSFRWNANDSQANQYHIHIEHENGTEFYDAIVTQTQIVIENFPADGSRFNWSVMAGNGPYWSNPASSYFVNTAISAGTPTGLIVNKELRDIALIPADLSIDMNVAIAVTVLNTSSFLAQMGVSWSVRDPYNNVISEFYEFQDIPDTGPHEQYEFSDENEFTLSKEGVYTITIQLMAMYEGSPIALDSYEGVMCSVSGGSVPEVSGSFRNLTAKYTIPTLI